MPENWSGRFLTAFALLLPLAVPNAYAAPPDVADGSTSRLTAGAGILLSADDSSVITLTEVDGAEAVVRFVPLDGAGNTVGSGRVFVVGPLEQRTVRLRDEVVPEMLGGAPFRVEVLQGPGRVTVTATDRKGRALQPRADARPARRRAVAPPARLPSSEVLIDRAEASGELDSETALVYRVFALFGDARLPARYQGDDSAIKDSLYMVEVRGRFEALSAATKALVQPFLIPPAYRGSWASPTAGLAASRVVAGDDPLPCQNPTDVWLSFDTAFVRVWYRAGNSNHMAKANEFAKIIDTTIWPKLSGLMGPDHLPKVDTGESCHDGNDDRLDIYVTDLPINHFVSFEVCSPASGFIEVKPSVLPGVVAHEIFHAMQASFPLQGLCRRIGHENYEWWTEASAEWAIDFVFEKEDQSEQASISNFLSTPNTHLDYVNKAREYGAYLLPFYVYQSTGKPEFVKEAWKNCASQPALEAVDKAIGEFKNVWPKFVRENWNRSPIQDYLRWDNIEEKAHEDVRPFAMTGSDGSIPVEYDLPRLSATFQRYTFPDDSTSSVSFWNGATFKLRLGESSGVAGVRYVVEEADEDDVKGVNVRALIKFKDQEWVEEDWTKRTNATFCRDMLAERLTDLVLIISNSEFKERERRAKPPGMTPLVWASNMGCWKWTGTSTKTDALSGEVTTGGVTWTRASSSQDKPIVTYNAKGNILWSFSGFCGGSGTLPILGAPHSSMTTYNFIPREGSRNRTYAITGNENRVVNLMCPNGELPTLLGPWLQTPPEPLPGFPFPGATYLHVSGDGRAMEAAYIVNSFQQWKWKFKAERE
jgi:hypothetical protein